MADTSYYRVLLDEEWSLVDLYEFPRSYGQSYAFIYCFDSDVNPTDRTRINRALEQYPWQGGYSYVNIYTVLQNQIPKNDIPRIKWITKTSPGWLDLFLNVNVAIQVAQAVMSLSAASTAAALAYKTILKSLTAINNERKRSGLEEMQLAHAQAEMITSMCSEMATFMGFKSLQELHRYTGNPEVTLKLTLAHYRRVSSLVEYVHEGKATLPLDQRVNI
ncbi:MAG TPA: hypothetical protein VKP67_18955 [Xanthobacteraceae bacterium]|nr:hypothetical protein [Xanthobacteraceae bacterium]